MSSTISFKTISGLLLCYSPIAITYSQDDNDDQQHSHLGVTLASWRWLEYGTLLSLVVTVLLAGILKLAFHHTPIISRYLPESCVLIIYGIILGLSSYSASMPTLTSSLFFNVLLPPIILDSAYSLYDRDFLANLGSVLTFAILGTLINVFAIGLLIYVINDKDLMGHPFSDLDLSRCLVFSSLISAVDPVAVLAVFEEIGVNKGLYFLVFGESLLNDGVTVVLYNTMVTLSVQNKVDYTQYILAFFSFFTVVFGGLTVGVFIGALSAIILKHTDHTRVMQPFFILATAYLSYILAETIHWSGIISLIGCGLAQKRYAFPNISQKSYTTVKYSVKTLSTFCDCVIFLFLGMATVSHYKRVERWHLGFTLWNLALCLIVRFVGTFLLSFAVNQGRIKPIALNEQVIIAYGGLRGAVAFSLAAIYEDPLRDVFLTATLATILFTVFIQGVSIRLAVGWLRIAMRGTKDKSISSNVNEKLIDYIMAGMESVLGRRFSRHAFTELLRRFDRRYTKKLLIRKDATNIMAKHLERITLDEHYARLYGPAFIVDKGQQQNSGSEIENNDVTKLWEKNPFDRLRSGGREEVGDLEREVIRERMERTKMLRRSMTVDSERSSSSKDVRQEIVMSADDILQKYRSMRVRRLQRQRTTEDEQEEEEGARRTAH